MPTPSSESCGRKSRGVRGRDANAAVWLYRKGRTRLAVRPRADHGEFAASILSTCRSQT
jgi:hypothetical protein